MAPSADLSDLELEFLAANEPSRVLVNSIPKSGTTWMRTMIAMLPGYEEYPRAGVSGVEADQLMGVGPGQVFHGHIMSSQRLFAILASQEFATVFIYRDLRDVVVSDYYHRVALNPARAPAIFSELPKEELLRPRVLPQWCGSVKRYADVQNWIDGGFPTVRYEDLIENTAKELLRVLTDMGFVVAPRLASSIARRAAFHASSGRTPGDEDPHSPLRKGIVGDWRNHFSRGLHEEFLEEYGSLLRRYGYDVGPGDVLSRSDLERDQRP